MNVRRTVRKIFWDPSLERIWKNIRFIATYIILGIYLSLLLLFLCKKLRLRMTSEENFVNCLDLTSALLICRVRTVGWHFIIKMITVSCLLIPWFIIHHGAGHVVLRAGLILTFTRHFHDNDNIQPVKVCEASVSRGYCDRRSGNKVRLILLFKCHTVGVLYYYVRAYYVFINDTNKGNTWHLIFLCSDQIGF